MTDAATPNLALAERFAALVALAVEQPSEALAQREAARAVVEAARDGGVTLSSRGGSLLADGALVELPALARRLDTYAVEELGITPKASLADLLDLARLLASDPGPGDPAERFRARAAVLDAKALPRRMREKPPASAPTEPPAGAPAADASATPARNAPAEPAASPAAAPGAEPAGSAADEPAPRRTPRQMARSTEPAAPPPPRDAPVRLTRPLAVPSTSNDTLASILTALEHADEPRRLHAALDQLVLHCDLAFRQGRHDDLIEGLAALIAIEHDQLERDAADERRQAFNHAVRRLARPVLLRQVAMLRHRRAHDPLATERVQAALYRFGMDGAEAMIDEWVAAATPEARAACLESLRGLPRAQDALGLLAKDHHEVVVRQAVAVLGALRDPPSFALLEGLLAHPEPAVRRDAVAAVGRFETEDAFGALAFALGDESPLVRVRAVTALRARREARVLVLLEPLLRTETEREVLYAVVDAVGRLGTPEAVQALIPIAQGQGSNPLRETAALRIQACLALVGIRTPQAMAAVQVLRDDRDREVRQASMRLVAHARRRSTTQMAAVQP